jgi:AbrB family looped-hinge helix DNA binding protein
MVDGLEVINISKVTSGGKLTIPKDIREILNVEEGDKAVFYLDKEKNLLVVEFKKLK